MKKTILAIAAVVSVTAAAIVACTGSQAGNADKKDVLDSAAVVKRGEYLVNIIGCDDCHSPKRMGTHDLEIIPELRLSGYPSSRPVRTPGSKPIEDGWALFGDDFTSGAGPWGMSFAANLTSDATGIGNWTEENFITAIRYGKYKGMKEGRDLLPPMPWFVYKNMTDEDLKAIFAYLKTTTPVENVVPAPIPLSGIK